MFWTFWKKKTFIAYVFPKLQISKEVVRQISRRPRFRTPLDSQQAKVAQTLLKSARQHFHHIFSSLFKKLRCKMSLLVIYWILALFFNILTADDKYSLPNSENLPQSIHVQLCKKEKTFSKFLAAFLESKLSFEHFEKKMTVTAHVSFKLPKMWLDISLKRPVLEQPSTFNIINLYDSTFIWFVHHSAVNWVAKCLS